MPKAIDIEEKTLIIVSVEAVPASFTRLMASPSTMAKASILITGFLSPSITPIAIPVKAL